MFQLSLKRNVWLLKIKLKAEKIKVALDCLSSKFWSTRVCGGKDVKLKQMETQTSLFAIWRLYENMHPEWTEGLKVQTNKDNYRTSILIIDS